MKFIGGSDKGEVTICSDKGRDTPHAVIASISVVPSVVLSAMLWIIAVLTIASTAAGAALYLFEWPEGSFEYRMVELFWLDTERNIPTLYQCSSMLIASALFVLIGNCCRQYADSYKAVRWFTLAFVFVVLAIDEGVQIHETIGTVFGTSYGASWSFFYIPFMLVLGAWLLPFLLRLPRETRLLLVLSAALYVGGSVAVEMVGQAYAGYYGKTTPLYAGLATLEEVLEMVGVALLIFALLQHLALVRTSAGQ